MSVEVVDFTNEAGARLAGRLEMPAGGRPSAYALFAHCFTCSKETRAMVRIARALSAEGIAVLRFDFTGLGQSEGEFGRTTFSSNVDDLVAAARFLHERGTAPQLLVGHSLGGAAAIRAAERIESVRAVATLGAPSDPWHASRLFAESISEIEAAGEATVVIGERPFRVRRELLDDLRAARLDDALARLGRALLVMHSPHDATVDVEHAAHIYTAARHPKSFVSLDTADHLLTRTADADYAGRMIAAWASRYLDAPPPAETDAAASEAGVAAVTRKDGYRTEIRAGRHGLVVDEPVKLGGSDAGPTPYDLLLAGLGACTSITLQMYARRKGWPLDEVAVRLHHQRLHADDAQECEDRGPRLDRIDRVVRIDGELDAEQRARLLEIADRCPVHRSLSAGMLIETRGDTDGG
jgi:uncharacterized OsmC-like protein/alpha/beta superfamily hydrolase